MLGGALALSLSSCGGKAGGPGGGFQMPPMAMEVSTVHRTPVSDHFEAVGSVEAAEAIVVTSEVDGKVLRLPFTEGGVIEAGGLIAQLDDVQARADADRAAAQLEQARSTFRRMKAVVDQGAGAPQDLDDAQAALRVAEANDASARARLKKTRITAPFEGTLGSRRISPGAYIRPGDPITELTGIREIKVVFYAPERYMASLKTGEAVEVSAPAFPKQHLTGRVTVVEPVLDAATRSVRMIARVANPGGRFRPGMSANVTATIGRQRESLTVPSEAVFVQGGNFLVVRVGPDSLANMVPVKLGTRTESSVEILEGLSDGDVVIRAGHQKIFKNDTRVLPVFGAAPGSGAPGANPAAVTPPAGNSGANKAASATSSSKPNSGSGK